MNKNEEGGGRDIEATTMLLLEFEVGNIGRLLKNEVRDVTISTSVIEQLVQSTGNPISSG